MNNVKFHFKEEGRKWLNQLPELIAYSKQRWGLQMKEPLSLSINYVAPAIREHGEQIMVKICIPGEEFLNELRALKRYDTMNMVELLDYDRERGILLLTKVEPGHPLSNMSNDEKRTQIAAKVHETLTYPVHNTTSFPTTETMENHLRNITIKNPNGLGPYSVTILNNALSMYSHLNTTSEQRWLLHGDFHHDNILATGVEGEWTTIDPKGLIGEREYDFVQFLLNQLPKKNRSTTINRRIQILVEEGNLNKDRLIEWGFCHSVLATCWTVDHENNYNEDFYQGSKVFQHWCQDMNE
ncbi:aminoglycoside phosphotransferase family protein [Salinibacillus aidingensis]|uniref:aminoglycoside phosphotransferase family protein n=1 Tax=Salinibacillus aidingensis TaxID=237684 RepID=UPI0031E30495